MSPRAFLDELRTVLGDPDRVRADALTRHAQAHDASHFLLLPEAVVVPRDSAEVARLLQVSRHHGVPLTFRSGGTSLSGQVGHRPAAGGHPPALPGRRGPRRRTAGAGTARGHGPSAERAAGAPRPQARPGPGQRERPARSAACVANNSSGMACGTVENSYRTLESVIAVLPCGTVRRHRRSGRRRAAARPGAGALRGAVCGCAGGSSAIRARCAKLAQQFSMKNTMGYGVNALLDYDTPADDPRRTCWSAARARWPSSRRRRSGPCRCAPQAATALLVFDDLFAASAALPALVATGAATLELMDATSLRVGQAFPDARPRWPGSRSNRQAALLLEYQGTTAEELAALAAAAAPTLADLPTADPVELTGDAGIARRLVAHPQGPLRLGGRGPPDRHHRAAGGHRGAGAGGWPRPAGTWPCSSTATTTRDSVIFGHAKDGNIHFMLTERFETDEQLGRYSRLHRGHGRAGARPRRHAQGRARHRPGHGPVRAPPVRRRAVRGDARGQAAVRPATASSTPVSCSPTTRQRTCKHLKLAPDRGAGGGPVRRVRLLRAGVPEPQT